MKVQHLMALVWCLFASCLIWWSIGASLLEKPTSTKLQLAHKNQHETAVSTQEPGHGASPAPASRTPEKAENVRNAPHCDYTVGKWEGNLTWVPSLSKGCMYRVFTQQEAFECLENKLVVLVGNSNTRALYSALEGILRNKTITPRLEAKQTCENNQKNHSCGMDIQLEGRKGLVHLYYWGYVGGVYGRNYEDFFKFQKNADVVVMNAGVNMIQKKKENLWTSSTTRDAPVVMKFVSETFTTRTKVFWMTTTRICEAQPHFRKYTYKKSYWLNRPLHKMNHEIESHNTLTASLLTRPISVLDAARMASPPSLCPFYDDPLHHKAVDTHVANVLLNMVCK